MAIPRGISDEQFRREFFKSNPNFFSGGSANIDSLSRADRRNPQFRSLLASGQLLPVQGEEASAEDLFLSRLNAISGHSLSKASSEVPEEFLEAFRGFQTDLKQTRSTLGNFAKGVREGTTLPFTTSEAQRTRLIDRASTDLSRVLERSEADQFGQLSRRGLLPSSTTGFSGPATDVLSRNRAQTFEDPLTSFISDLDIQTEADFVANRNRLREVGVNVDQFLGNLANAGAQTAGQFGLGIGNLGLQNLNSQRGFVNQLLGQLGQFEQFGLQKEAFERNQRLQSDAIFQAEDALKQSQSNTFGNFLGGPGGKLLGSLGGAFLGGPAGAFAGAKLFGGGGGSSFSGGQALQGNQVGQFAGFANPGSFNPSNAIAPLSVFSQTRSFR